MSLRYDKLADVPQHLLKPRGSLPKPAAPTWVCPVPAEKPKRAKYGNKVTELDGYVFDSAFEAQRYRELKNMQDCGLITELRVHPEYALHVNGIRIGLFELDFDYLRALKKVVEDVKSKVTKTRLFHWKCDHLRAEYDLEVTVIQKQRKRA